LGLSDSSGAWQRVQLHSPNPFIAIDLANSIFGLCFAPPAVMNTVRRIVHEHSPIRNRFPVENPEIINRKTLSWYA
jgi:hypothetical protein